ncbi:major facilitator superfamily domain-containing protein [Podospora didyma]|uniref:Major facilitator superfamily domain-containing protein n=1 Tax=Podospora didyma TaxID=330526 RepID=A0AAE0K9Y3_9PEZI|nr:major facilitator superfamily domain-containing protein [Podospora didyma]
MASQQQHFVSDMDRLNSHSAAMFGLVALAKFAAFTDVFLSGLLIPLIPSIIEERVQVPHEQVQVWTSVLISAYGGAFVAVSPLMPFLTLQGPKLWVVLLVGLACAAGSFALLQFYSYLPLLVFARVLHGLAGAAIAGACSGMISTAAAINGRTDVLIWITPAVIQFTAMAAAPLAAGYLHDFLGGEKAIFTCGYAIIALAVLLSILLTALTPDVPADASHRGRSLLEHERESYNYGTVSLRGGAEMRSEHSSRSSSPGLMSVSSRRSSVSSSRSSMADTAPPPFGGLRLSIALYGYLVFTMLMTALQSVLPLFAGKHFSWTMSANGNMLLVLSAPAALIGLLSGALTGRIPKASRFLATIGFLACYPAFLFLGRDAENSPAAQEAFLVAIGVVSLGLGLCGDPLVREIMRAVARVGYPSSVVGDPLSVEAQTSTLPGLAHAWGSLIGPLFACSVSWVFGWATVARSLAMLAASTAVLTLLFLHGWIGSLVSQSDRRFVGPNGDEESAPLLGTQNPDTHSYRGFSGVNKDGEDSGSLRKGGFYERNTALSESEDPEDGTVRRHKPKTHRRQFSVDNFSITSPTVYGGTDGEDSASLVRFQATLETPLPGTAQKSAEQRRFVMREAPHAPATDPLLAAGNRYVVDETRSTAPVSDKAKRHVVVFEEGSVAPELLQRRQHHVVAINSTDGTATIVPSKDDHTVQVTEETGDEQSVFSEESSRRYVVVVLEEGDDGAELGGEASRRWA